MVINRDSLLVKVQRTSISGMFRPKWDIYITFFPLKALGTLKNRKQKDFKS